MGIGLGRRNRVALAVLGSAGLLGGALFFQYGMGLAPCELCLWQRWPHGAAIVLGLIALSVRALAPLAVLLAMLALLIGAGIAAYHVGIEQGWWTSAACGTPDVTAGSAADLLARIQAAPLVACDEVAWSLWGLSMAAWNGLFSLALAALLLSAALARPASA